MKKLVILTQYFRPEIGAPQNRLYELAEGLRARDWLVEVITAMPNYPTGRIFKEYNGKFSIEEDINGIRVKRYWLYASNSKKALPRILSMLSFSFSALCSLKFIRRSKPEFIFVESPPLTLGITGFLLSKLSGARLIFNVSDLWPLSAMELGYISRGVVFNGLEKVERYIYKKSTLCTGQSEEIVTYIMQNGASKVFLFRNGVDTTRFRGLKHNQIGEKVKLIYTGLLGVAQGILKICENIDFSKLEAEFHIYGAGTEKESLESFLALNPDRGIYYHGPVAREEIPQVLSSCDISLIALVKNIYGAVPSKMYESMAAGLPILFSGDGEGRKIVENNNLGWTTDPGDYEALSEKISHLQQMNEEISIKRVNCVNAAEKIFNRQTQINAFHLYLAELIAEK